MLGLLLIIFMRWRVVGSLKSHIELQIEAAKIELQNLEKELKLQLKIFFEVYNGALNTKSEIENLVEESKEIALTSEQDLFLEVLKFLKYLMQKLKISEK